MDHKAIYGKLTNIEGLITQAGRVVGFRREQKWQIAHTLTKQLIAEIDKDLNRSSFLCPADAKRSKIQIAANKVDQTEGIKEEQKKNKISAWAKLRRLLGYKD